MPEISKTMCIEMGHRLQHHQGKCRNLHGHSYKIEVTVIGPLQTGGPAKGMVIDFAQLKNAMSIIDRDFDHKTCLEVNDPLLLRLVSKFDNNKDQIYSILKRMSYLILAADSEGDSDQLYVLISQPPTAEVLATLWRDKVYEILRVECPEIVNVCIKVWETSTSCVEVM